MPFFKNHKKDGVTIVEVMLAIALVSILSLGVLSLQQTLIKTTMDGSSVLYNMRILNNFMVDSCKAELENKKIVDEKSEDEPKLARIEKKLEGSDVFKNIKDLIIVSFEISWSSFFGKQKEEIVTLSYSQLEQESEKLL